MKRFLAILILMLLPGTLYAQQLDRRICDAAGDCLNVNSDGTIPISGIVGGGSGDITDVYDCATGDCNNIAMTDGDNLDMSAVDAGSPGEGLTLPQNTSCSGSTGEGQVCWDSNGDVLFVGTGTIASGIYSGAGGPGGGTGDITDVYNCSSGDCNNIVLADSDLLNMSSVNASSTTEGLILPQTTECSASTAEGQVCWQSGGNVLFIGTGSGVTGLYSGIALPGVGGIGDMLKAEYDVDNDLYVDYSEVSVQLATDGNDCPEGQYARGVDEFGYAQNCVAVPEITDENSPWTALTGYVYLHETTNDVIVGGTVPVSGGKFSVDGDLDQTQLVVSGHTTQNSPLVDIKQGSGDSIFVIRNEGRVEIGTGINGSISIAERASADSSVAGYVQIWGKNDSPNTLWFTDDTGVDHQLGLASTGTPGGSNTQMQFNRSSSFGGVSGWTSDGANLASTSILNISTGTVYLPQQSSCTARIKEGDACWDIESNVLFVGTGTVASPLLSGTGTGGGTGDITDVYNCSSGDCNNIVLADGDLLNMASVNASSSTEGLILPQTTNCSSATGEGQLCWNSAGNVLFVGTGSVASGIYSSVGENQTITLSGDVTGSGKTAITTAVTDDSHNHTTTTISGLDVSSDTNLAVSGSLLALTGDTLSVNAGTLTNSKYCIYTTGTGIVCNSEGGAGTSNYRKVLEPQQAKLDLTANASMVIEGGLNRWAGEFDAAVDQCATWEDVLTPYSGTLKINLTHTISTLTTGVVYFGVRVDCHDPNGTEDFGAASWGTTDVMTSLVGAASGYPVTVSDAALNGDSCSEGDLVVFSVCRDANNTSDTAGDVRLRKGYIYAE